jgi:hypothetical protein
MTVERRVARAFRLDDAGWARHANPWSAWTRALTALPFLVAAIWSRVWWGPWSLVAVAVALAWIWLNPRAFGPAADDSAWMTKGVLGERLWANRDRVPVPERHRIVPKILNLAQLSGVPFVVWGLVDLQLWPTVVGALLIAGIKLWYIDRMAILYGDMTSAAPQLRYR